MWVFFCVSFYILGKRAKKPPNKIAISDYRIKSPYEVKSKAPDDLEVAKDFEDDKCLTFFTEKAKEWIQSRNKNKPFFLYLSYTSPHKPVIPLPEFRGKGKAGAYGEFMIETDHHVGEILETLDKENISCEIIDLRTVRPMDHEAILNSVKKTNRLVILEEAWPFGNVATEITYQVQSQAFDYLDAPIEKINTADTPAPYSPVLLKEWLPNSEDVIKAVKKVLYK